MVNRNEEPPRVSWLPVYDNGTGREPVAPSKPAVPARTAVGSQPEPIVIEDPGADIIAPVTMPPPQEIMPTDGHAPWESVPVFSIPTEAPAPPAMDPVRSLGDAAVRRASLSASGAATPLGGVAPYLAAPSAPASIQDPPVLATPGLDAEEPAELAVVIQEPPWLRTPDEAAPSQATPAEPVEDVGLPPASAVLPTTTTAPGFMAATPPQHVPSPPRSSTPELDEEPAAYTPLFGNPVVTGPSGGASNGEEPPMTHKRTPWWRRWPFLVVIGLLVMGGIAYGVITALSDSEPVELTPEVIVAEPEEPSHEPITIENPTAFQDALPQIVGLYALTGFESPDPSTLDLVERAAEANILTYQHDDITLSVRAIQHFDTEAALRHFDAIAVDGTNRVPVSAGSSDVGERVNLSAEDGETIVWRNSSAVFFVTGPADAVEEFFTQFPL